MSKEERLRYLPGKNVCLDGQPECRLFYSGDFSVFSVPDGYRDCGAFLQVYIHREGAEDVEGTRGRGIRKK